ncbi:unnamed protein product [Urochloa decumbens]|uniref:Protein kinase domain-containing protein n=1 Tax=Urochloa decumbens TaxID=240449 RepID=A0ABC8W966_9POAL
MRGTAAALLLLPLLLHAAAVAAGNGSCELGLLVSNVTARALFLTLRPDCSRRLDASVKELFTDNYAPGPQNALVVSSCNNAAARGHNCSVHPATYLNSSSYCFHGAKAENFSCVQPPIPPSGNRFLNETEILALGSECTGLVSAASLWDTPAPAPALVRGVMELEWWILGPCRCSPRADCTSVTTPTAELEGFRCECIEGFVGDGFAAGAGCQRGPPPPVAPTTLKPLTIISLSVSTGFILCLIILSTLARLFWPRRQKRAKNMAKGLREESLSNDEAMDDELKNGAGPKRFRYDELAIATDDFSDEQKLGQGGFGSVYKGFLESENLQVAIKRVSRSSKQGRKEYVSEVKIISRLRHRNLVQLIGWCHDGGELLLVYELMPNGSLDTHLYKAHNTLSWTA